MRMKSSELAPIVLFVYNRPEHTRRTVEALRANYLARRSRLFVFSDAPKDDGARSAVEEVRRYVASIDGFASVELFKQNVNQGLAASVIAGVTRFAEEFGRVIVLEDDLLTSPYFLDYMNDGLELYRDEPDVASIQAYMYPLDLPSVPDSYFLPSLGCWGWGTWQRAWKNFEPNGLRLLQEIRSQKLSRKFDLNNSYPRTKLLQLQVQGKVDSWAIRWIASNFLLDKKGLFPARSLIQNIGLDGTGTHFNKKSPVDITHIYNTDFSCDFHHLQKVPVVVNEAVLQACMSYLAANRPPNIFVRAIQKIRFWMSGWINKR